MGPVVLAGGRYTRGVERLQKVLARLGVASRRGAEELIRAGRVSVNGRSAELGMRVGPTDSVAVDGKSVARQVETVTLMLNKPRGVLSTARDERGRQTVMDLVPPSAGLHPVGRLDRDSEGLLLLSSDGELTLRLTHPRYGHRKTYRVWCAPAKVPDAALARLCTGVELEDGPALALAAARLPGGCELVLAEGRKRQVRRMLAVVGFEVVRLQRTKVGDLGLGDLAPGKWLELGERDIALALASGR